MITWSKRFPMIMRLDISGVRGRDMRASSFINDKQIRARVRYLQETVLYAGAINNSIHAHFDSFIFARTLPLAAGLAHAYQSCRLIVISKSFAMIQRALSRMSAPKARTALLCASAWVRLTLLASRMISPDCPSPRATAFLTLPDVAIPLTPC